MKISFLGAAQEVTGSRYLIEHDGTKILVDCGMFQGGYQLSKRNFEPFPIDPRTIDAIVLTHAHLDHTGYIPALVKHGFKGKIYCSKATYDLCAIVLLDSGSLQEDDAKRANKNRDADNLVVPLYTKTDAQRSLNSFQTVDYDTVLNIKTLQITLIYSGHILGSSFVIVSDGKNRLTFSGDLGRPHQLIMKSPTHLKQTDFLVIESTYGDRIHAQGDPIKDLGEAIRATVEKSGVLIIPVFAVERAQTILYCLYQLQQKKIIPHIPIFLDSPMAIAVNNVFCHYPEQHIISSSVCNDIVDTAKNTDTVEQSKAIDQVAAPAIILSGSGMADGGRVLHHFKHFISDARNTVLFVGFQAEGTHGHDLVNGAKRIELYGEWYNVHAQIKTINTFSAHADYNEILQWLGYFQTAPKKVFITHGQIEAAESLKKKIEERLGWPVVIVPKYLESFDLD